MRKGFAQTLMYGGACVALASAFGELKAAKDWAEVLSPSHVFGFLSAVCVALGALFHPVPKEHPEIQQLFPKE